MKPDTVSSKGLRHKRVIGNEQGLALLITVSVLTLLVAVTVQFHRTTWQTFRFAWQNMVFRQLQTAAESGQELAISVLEDDRKNNVDSLLETWAKLSRDNFDFLAVRGTLEIDVQDLGGRFPINALGLADGARARKFREIFFKLLVSGRFYVESKDDAREIIDSLVDWLDADSKESDKGAENSYYRGLTVPYSCKNGPVNYPEELLFVKGITARLFFGDEEKEGLQDYITVYKDEKTININTAPVQLLESLMETASEKLARGMDEYRRDPANEKSLNSRTWYKKVAGWPGDLTLDESIIDVKSSCFRIISKALYDKTTRVIVTDIKRRKDKDALLLFRRVE